MEAEAKTSRLRDAAPGAIVPLVLLRIGVGLPVDLWTCASSQVSTFVLCSNTRRRGARPKFYLLVQIDIRCSVRNGRPMGALSRSLNPNLQLSSEGREKNIESRESVGQGSSGSDSTLSAGPIQSIWRG